MTGTRPWHSDAELEQQPAPAIVEPQPTTLGRYELRYQIGKGGMANVFLAQSSGPAGFRRWFAIKRIHPHLADDKRFLHMFLDEARIAAALQHPNVAQVFELGKEAGTYFIAMEYLHGEHLGALAKMAAKHGPRPAIELGAWIVSQAARGLHHAHEARDEQGRPLEVVHRDVSPQNIFVTYDGNVKVTDFGIAKAKNRQTDTKTGELKGKFAYMAPEQVLGQPVDRQADVFALGTVLWETTTGRHLFLASNDGQTLFQITYGSVTRPCEIVPDYPPALEAIVMRALERLPSARYATCDALASDLEGFLRESGKRVGPKEVGELMDQLFAERIAAKTTVLHAGGSLLPGALQVEMDQTFSSWSHASSHIGTVDSTPQSRRRRVAVVAGLSAAVLVLAAAVVWMAASGGAGEMAAPVAGPVPPHVSVADTRPSRAALEPAPAVTPPPVDPVVDPSVVAADLPVVAADAPAEMPSVAETLSSSSEHRATAHSRGEARLNLLTRPWANVWVNGRLAGTTPLMNHRIPAGQVVVRLEREDGTRRSVRFRARPGELVSRTVVLE